MLRLCPGIRDREDEEEIQKHFCFVLGGAKPLGRRVLDHSEQVAPYFPPGSPSHLLLQTTGQPQEASSLHRSRPHPPEEPLPVSHTGSESCSLSPGTLLRPRTGTIVTTDTTDSAEEEGPPGEDSMDSSAQRTASEPPPSPSEC